MTVLFGAQNRDVLNKVIDIAQDDPALEVQRLDIAYRELLPVEMGLPRAESTAAAFAHSHSNVPGNGFCQQRFPDLGAGRQHLDHAKIRAISDGISNHRERIVKSFATKGTRFAQHRPFHQLAIAPAEMGATTQTFWEQTSSRKYAAP